MYKILIINEGKWYLTEIPVYKKYFNERGILFFYDSKDFKECDLTDFDLTWHFMGLSLKRSEIPQVHEYLSLSTGKLPRTKNFIKRVLNTKPICRVFQNEFINNEMNFNDKIQYKLRPLGVDNSFFITKAEKEFDFVYIGAIDKERNTSLLLNIFKENMKNKTLLVIGHVPNDIYNSYKHTDNIIFTGRIDYYEVPKIASKAIYGINFFPTFYPHTYQGSTKLLDYIAIGLNVITTNTPWLAAFEKENPCSFYKIEPDLSNFNFKKIETFQYKTPDIRHLTWEKILKNTDFETLINKSI